jgi:chromosomal replication initiator protein
MDSLWLSLVSELKQELPAQQYDTWIKPLRAERNGNELRVVAPNHHVLRWIRANLLKKLESRAEHVAGSTLRLDLVLDDKQVDTEIIVPEPVAIVPERPSREEHRLNPSAICPANGNSGSCVPNAQ